MYIECNMSQYNIILSRLGIYKCIFRGGSSNQILANILEMEEWRVKFYDQQQCTYIMLYNNDSNIEADEENLIIKTSKQHKLRYKCGQLVVKWKQQKNIDFNGNFT
uniref:Uncharacterized protein n=1 Tax=Rhizophagus irregularis (strain DAOM 181602 / DAOM 197198 / MUCL 43194) TaxID=747089 RepID=U9TY36_RHIID